MKKYGLHVNLGIIGGDAKHGEGQERSLNLIDFKKKL